MKLRPIVRSICAIGQRGQLGLDGRLPWEGAHGREYVTDVERFFEITVGHVLLAGPRTIGSLPEFARASRTATVIRSGEAFNVTRRMRIQRTFAFVKAADGWRCREDELAPVNSGTAGGGS